MKNSQKPSFMLIGLIVTQLFIGCTTNTLLNADFESDTLGGPPSMDLPGEPTGDRLDCITCDGGDYRIVAKTTGSPPVTSKWLQMFGRVRTPTTPIVMTLVPKAGTMDRPVYTVSWKGSVLHPPVANSSPFGMTFYSGVLTGSQAFFSLDFRRELFQGDDVSNIYLLENNGNDDSEVLIGRVRPETIHYTTVFINAEDRTFTITGSGLPINIERNIPTGITNVRAPWLYLTYLKPGVGGYQFDTIQIIEGKRREE